MCGIVGGYARGEIGQMLVEGLRRLEYRGYDSAGVVIADHQGVLRRARAMGKVSELATQLGQFPLTGRLGIAHTRWATHGVPSERNAHPHISRNRVAVVHNGIIENHAELRVQLMALGYTFTSETDTEVVAHWIEHRLCGAGDLLTAVRQAVQDFEGAYALGVICSDAPDRLIATRKGSPLVIGLGDGENYIASDSAALLKVTQRFVYLEEGDFVELKQSGIRIIDECGNEAVRPVKVSSLSFEQAEKGAYDHYMLKEIHEQPRAVADTLEGRIVRNRVLVNSFGPMAAQVFARVRQVQIVACGTSYHAGMVARYWFEDILGLPSQVEIASEFRYRNPVLQEHTLMVLVSQSGETADTLAALRNARRRHPGLMSLAVCNVPESSLVRESDLVLMTNAGPEVGVASTKACSTQLAALGLLLVAMGKVLGRLSDGQEARIVEGLEKIPGRLADALRHDAPIRALARRLVSRQHALFLGRGTMYPIALEGALKLKEISYIHAEAYPAGELKHGPLALIDADMPVIAVAPCNDLLKKLKSNLEEVSARGAELFLFTDEFSEIVPGERIHVLPVTANVGRISAPVIFNVPLQLLAYHVAVLRGSDVDQPRNLAKSVTVE